MIYTMHVGCIYINMYMYICNILIYIYTYINTCMHIYTHIYRVAHKNVPIFPWR